MRHVLHLSVKELLACLQDLNECKYIMDNSYHDFWNVLWHPRTIVKLLWMPFIKLSWHHLPVPLTLHCLSLIQICVLSSFQQTIDLTHHIWLGAWEIIVYKAMMWYINIFDHGVWYICISDHAVALVHNYIWSWTKFFIHCKHI